MRPWLEYILAGSNVDDYESLQYFQRQLGESGILDALVQKGVQENDTILIGEYQFDYIFLLVLPLSRRARGLVLPGGAVRTERV